MEIARDRPPRYGNIETRRSLLPNTSKYETRSLLIELQANGMYLGDAIINEALQQAGEID